MARDTGTATTNVTTAVIIIASTGAPPLFNFIVHTS